MTMKSIIEPVSREVLKSEMRPEYLLRTTNRGGNEIYVITAAECPNIMLEIGRLREWAFRSAGGGTGEGVDIDELDTIPNGYMQLFVWDPSANEIIGGYRYIVSHTQNPKYLSTEHYFIFNDNFRRDVLPYTIELGRSFVHPKYQNTSISPKGLYAMDNLWDGLGALIVNHPEAKYFFGKVTMYTQYDTEARNILLYFLHKHFPDRHNYMEPRYPIEMNIDTQAMERLFPTDDYRDNYKTLVRELRERGEFIPPMISSYMNVSPSMQVFSTVSNPDFGDVEETGILVTLADMYPQKTERHTHGIEKMVRPFKRFRTNAKLALDEMVERTAPTIKVGLRPRKNERLAKRAKNRQSSVKQPVKPTDEKE